MKLNRSNFRIYIDIVLFIAISMACTLSMIIGIFTNDHIVEPVIFFILVYLINLIFYRVFVEIKGFKLLKNKLTMDTFLTSLCALSLMTTIFLVIYLIYFAFQALWGKTLIEILMDHVLYATVVGSLFMIHLAFDNMTTFYNLCIGKK